MNQELYEKTLERLFYQIPLPHNRAYEDDVQIAVFNALSSLISDFYTKVDILHGERKESALKVISELQFVFNHIGVVYLYSLKAREKMLEVNKRLMELAEENSQLKERIRQLEEMENF